MKSEKMREEFEKYVSNQGVSLDYQGDGVYGNIKVRRWYEGALIAHEILDNENEILKSELKNLQKLNDDLEYALERVVECCNQLGWDFDALNDAEDLLKKISESRVQQNKEDAK